LPRFPTNITLFTPRAMMLSCYLSDITIRVNRLPAVFFRALFYAMG
jgi:hypothetical protein